MNASRHLQRRGIGAQAADRCFPDPLVIVEVKARSTKDAGLYAVTPTAQDRIARAAAVLAGRWRLTALPIRFDVVVIGAGWPKHIAGAWDVSLVKHS